MEREVSSIVWLGITLVALSIVISIAFNIFSVGKRVANTGINDIVAEVEYVNNSKYYDYNQQELSGIRVKSIIDQMSSEDCALLVSAIALRNCQTSYGAASGDLGVSTWKYNVVPTNLPSQSSNGIYVNDTSHGVRGSDDSKYYTLFINYGAQLGDAGKAVLSDVENRTGIALGVSLNDSGLSSTTDDAAVLTMKDGIFTSNNGFITNTDGTIKHGTRTVDMDKEGTTMNIKDGSIYKCLCIKSSTGEYIGLAFLELDKH